MSLGRPRRQIDEVSQPQTASAHRRARGLTRYALPITGAKRHIDADDRMTRLAHDKFIIPGK